MALSMILLGNVKIVIGLQFDGSRGSPSLGIGVMFPTAHFNGNLSLFKDSFRR